MTNTETIEPGTAPDVEGRVQNLVDTALGDEAMASMKKKLGSLTDDIYGYIEYQMKDDLAANLASLVHRQTNEAIKALLAGDEKRMRTALDCDEYYNGRETRFPVIHGKLNEYGPVELRRKIVQAFSDLVRNERILDLECQVAGLLAEVNKANAETERVREYYRDREP